VPGSARSIVSAAQNLGAAIRIVLTHAHFDYVGALDALVSGLPAVEIAIGQREARFLAGNLSLDPGETGKKLLGFRATKTQPTRLLADGERIGSLKAVLLPGHTPGHMAYLDVRDGSLIAGDAFTTQWGLVAAGVFKPQFPFPAFFSWNAEVAAESARKLMDLKPILLAVGHGKTLASPVSAKRTAVEFALKQRGKVLN